MKRSGWLLIFVCALLMSSAFGQDKCSVRTTHARYGTTCQGFVSTGAGQPLTPFSLLGTCTGDANGFFTCQGTQSFGGLVVPALDEGQSTVNTDYLQQGNSIGTGHQLSCSERGQGASRNAAECRQRRAMRPDQNGQRSRLNVPQVLGLRLCEGTWGRRHSQPGAARPQGRVAF